MHFPCNLSKTTIWGSLLPSSLYHQSAVMTADVDSAVLIQQSAPLPQCSVHCSLFSIALSQLKWSWYLLWYEGGSRCQYIIEYLLKLSLNYFILFQALPTSPGSPHRIIPSRNPIQLFSQFRPGRVLLVLTARMTFSV